MTRTVRLLFAAGVAVQLFFSTAFSFNHPEIEWKTVESKHFKFHYYDKTEPALYAAWRVAEDAYESLSKLYEYESRRKINVALADYDDYSNGFAAWTMNAIMVWVPDGEFDLRGNPPWLSNVLTHELAHIISLKKKRGLQLLNWDLALEYHSPNSQLSLHEPIALTPFFPNWFIEGTAQLGSESQGYDCWDTRRDMVLRCATLEKRLLSLSEMGNFTHGYVGNELVYNQGYSLTRRLEQKIGAEGIAKLWQAARDRDLFGFSLSSYLEKNHNFTTKSLYREWVDSLQKHYSAMRPENPTPGKDVWIKGTYNLDPKVSTDGKYWGWLTNHRDDFRRTDLVVARYGETKPIARIAYAKEGWDFIPNSSSVCYIKSREPNENGSYLNDIFRTELGTGEETRLTRSARVYDIACSPDGSQLACIRFEAGAYSLETFSLSTRQFTNIRPGELGRPFVSLSYSPNGSDLVVSRRTGGNADLLIVSLDKDSSITVLGTPGQELTPYWSSNNRIYFSADYDGIFNIYSISSDGSDLQRYSTVVGGAFSPALGADNPILVSEYTAGGFKIRSIAGEGTPYEIPEPVQCAFEPLPEPTGTVKIRATDYDADYLRPAWSVTSVASFTDTGNAAPSLVGEGDFDGLADTLFMEFATYLSMFRTDAVGRKSSYLGVGGLLAPVKTLKEDSTEETGEELVAGRKGMSPGVRSFLDQRRGRPHHRSLHERSQHSFNRSVRGVRANHRLSLGADTTIDADSVDEGEESWFPIMGLFGFWGVENASFTPTIGFELSGVLNMAPMPVPGGIQAMPYLYWHVTRPLYVGISANVSLQPFALPAGVGYAVQIPVWMEWANDGYFNEDFGYNFSDVTYWSVAASPFMVPFLTIEDEIDGDGEIVQDTTATPLAGIQIDINGGRRFRMTKYGAFGIDATVSATFTGDSVEWTGLDLAGIPGKRDLEGATNGLYLFTNTLDFTYPLIRNINFGRRIYADNLYGRTWITHGFFADDGAFETASRKLLEDPRRIPGDLQVIHTLGQDIYMGVIKNSIFQRTLNLSVSYDFVAEAFGLGFGMSF